jgi:hypothetical protein
MPDRDRRQVGVRWKGLRMRRWRIMRKETQREDDRGGEDPGERRFIYLGAGYFLDRKTGRLIAL